MSIAGFFRNGVDSDLHDFSNIIYDLYYQFSTCLSRPNTEYYVSQYQKGQNDAVSFLSNCDTVVLCTHGDKHGLYFDHGLHKYLIDLSNISVIQDKCIVAISCYTLYHNSIFRTPHNKSKVFLGFRDEFYLATTPTNAPDEQSVVLDLYTDILINAIVNVSISGGTFQDLHDSIKLRVIEKGRDCSGFAAMFIDDALSRLDSVDLVGDGTTLFLPEPV
ncbi:MAG: hypothetical protein WCS32_02960 [Candidatus Izemoplasmatales bacterium]